MKIEKYKKNRSGTYSVYLDNGSILNLYEETILEYNLLINKNVDNIEDISEFNLKYEAYYTALKSINNRYRSVYEVRKLLKEKAFREDLIDFSIDKLISQKYLDDRVFTKLYINNQIVTTNRGPYRIKSDLLNKGVDSNICDDELIVFDEELQLERIDKLITKMIKNNHSRGGVVLKTKIFNDLKNLGYDVSVINKIINDYDYGNNKELYKKEYDKLYKRLSKKYSGSELEYKINERLYQKGLYYEKNS